MTKKKFNLKKEIERVDKNSVGLTSALFTKQITQVAREFPRALSISKKKWDSIVICAMGGSALGTDVLRYVYEPYLKVPFLISHGYNIPSFVTKNSLVVVMSYSGSTEEILSCLKQAKKRNLTTFVISSGGKLAKLADTLNVPNYVFGTENNPSNQPRMGGGYTMTAVYMLIKKLGLLKAGYKDLVEEAEKIKVSTAKSFSLAQRLHGKSCILMASGFLSGNAHVFSNQLNESAKMFAPFYFISELNHHLLEGLGSIHSSVKNWRIVMIESNLYSSRIHKRFKVTAEVLKKQGFVVEKISFEGNAVAQALGCLSFGGWTSYYLSIVAGRDPSLIPWVDYFKKRMA